MDDGLGGLDFLKAGADFTEDRSTSGVNEDDDGIPDPAGVTPAQPTAGKDPASPSSAAPAATVPPATVATPAQPAAVPAATPAQATVPEVTPPAVPAQTPAAAPAALAQPAQAAQVAAPAQPDPMADYGTWRKNAVDVLAKGPFALSEETAAALQDNPAEVLPALAANVYLMAVENATAVIREMLPQVVPTMMEQRSAMTKAVESFNSAAPDLVPHMDRVVPISNFLRSQNPDMPTDKFIPLVAATARQMLGLQASAAAPVAPAAPVATSLPPHTPVVAQAPRAGVNPNQPSNPWADMAGAQGSVSADDEDN